MDRGQTPSRHRTLTQHSPSLITNQIIHLPTVAAGRDSDSRSPLPHTLGNIHIMLASAKLFADDNPLAIRPPKTDRLILDRELTRAAPEKHLDPEIDRAHPILIKWADLESSGQLAQMQETQLQGEFFGDVFGNALGYTLFSEGLGKWSLQQHLTINGGTPDAVLGNFRAGSPHKPIAVVELKGPNVHLDRDRSNGRTAVQQCWEYLNHTPQTCRWGIVSNIISFRLYERSSTPRRFEHFTLQDLRKPEIFRRFYATTSPDPLLPGSVSTADHILNTYDYLKSLSLK
jgi:hypothetical protein